MTLDYLAHIRSESARFGEALRSCDPSAQVPTCPDWTARDLLAHMVKVQAFWGTIVRDRLDDPAAAEAAEDSMPTDYAELLSAFDDTAAELQRVLAEAEDDVAVWTWSDDHTVGFIRRRQAHEALIHRMDAEMTASVVTEFDPGLALDGVDEALRIMLGGQASQATETPGQICGEVRVDGTDSVWRFRLRGHTGVRPGSEAPYDEPGIELDDDIVPSFTVSGAAGDLDAWLWNRPTWGNLTLEGDHAGFDRFRALTRGAIP
jgi:uncharacterized protein (TIGR03083 family)